MIRVFETRSIVKEEYPAFQWAQSPDYMFVEIKYSPRIDTKPLCETLEDVKVVLFT
jgi:hypothetical protein